jgi:flagellar basal-body rod modification protein FlgD
MAISGISSNDTTVLAGASGSTTTNKSSTTLGGGFDTDTFMQLLLAELQHQDPLEPMNNTELVGQMAQLNSLQKLTSLDSNIDTMKDYMETLLGISS